VGEACGPAAPVGTTVCPSAGQLVRANRIKVRNPHRPKITGVDSLRRSAAVESERLGGIAAQMLPSTGLMRRAFLEVLESTA
jgi:hypothetical protein